MKNFSFRSLRSLSLRQHIFHAVVTFGLPLFIVELFFIDYNNDFWLVNVLLALFIGLLSGVIFGVLEHGFFKGIRKGNRDGMKE